MRKDGPAEFTIVKTTTEYPEGSRSEAGLLQLQPP
jgi:hypothetical protein